MSFTDGPPSTLRSSTRSLLLSHSITLLLALVLSQVAEYRRLRAQGSFDVVVQMAPGEQAAALAALAPVCDRLARDMAAAWDEDMRTPS